LINTDFSITKHNINIGIFSGKPKQIFIFNIIITDRRQRIVKHMYQKQQVHPVMLSVGWNEQFVN